MCAEGPKIFHALGVGRAHEVVAYDPRRLSPGAVHAAIEAAVALCAAVEGLDVAPTINQPTAAKVLRKPLKRMQRQLEAIGAIFPRDLGRQ